MPLSTPITQAFYQLAATSRNALRCLILSAKYYFRPKIIGESLPQFRILYGNAATEFSGRVCVFSHYDRNSTIDPHVLNYLTALKDLGFRTIIVSTAANLSEESIQKAEACCELLIVKDNFGYDFGSWKAALTRLNFNPQKTEILLLANDSVYAPILPLDPIFKKMQEGGYDVYGITDSFQLRYHVQSYFMAFSPKAVNSPAFSHYWTSFPYLSSKDLVIWAGETGLSQTLIKAGLKVGAYIQYKEVLRKFPEIVRQREWQGRLPVFLNMSHSLWEILVQEYQCPVIKVNLLLENPTDVPNINKWEDSIKKISDYDILLIRNHLNRIKNI